MATFRFKFFNGQVFTGRGDNERAALVALGLGAYNPVAYTAERLADDAEIPHVPCLECDGSGWLDDDRTEMCCECDGTGTEIVSD
jgi:hypothetical protein